MGTGNVIANIISSVFWIFLGTLLGVEHYGELSYDIALASIAAIIANFGIGSTIIIYTAKGVKVNSTLYLISITSGVLTSVILYFLVSKPGVSLYVIGYIFFSLITGEMLGMKRYGTFSKFLIIQRILVIIFSLGLYYIIGPTGVLLGFALSFFPFSFKIYHRFKKSEIDFRLLKPRLGFMISNYALELSRTFSGSTDKLIIYPIFGFAFLGNYQLGVQVLGMLSLLPSIVYQYILPHDASGTGSQKLKHVTIISSVGLAILGIVLAPTIIPYMFPKFKDAVLVVQIMSLATIPLTINLMYISKFLGLEKNKIVLIGSVVYLTVLVLSIVFLGKSYYINGVAASPVLAAASETTYLLTITKIIQGKKNTVQ
ncbi:MAG: oligosaccharide flippase family protein [Thaumarchaeota archaeon]|nr:oligosaccharide flippase family protein [Nitrososphaerota archaeon]